MRECKLRSGVYRQGGVKARRNERSGGRLMLLTQCILLNLIYSVIHEHGLSSCLYGLNSKRRLNTRQTVGCGIPSSLLALPVDLRGLRSKLSIRLTFSSDTRGRPEILPLHRQPYLLKLVISMTNALPSWRLTVETKTERTLYSSRRLSFNELTNAKKSCAA